MPTIFNEAPSLFDVLDDDDKHGMGVLLTQGLKVNEPDESDSMRTLLMLAARESGPNVVRLLLQSGASVHAQDDDGWSALHHLAGSDHPSLASLTLLLGAGADPNAIARSVDEDEEDDTDLANAETPMTVAANFSNEAVLRRLIKAGGIPQVQHLRGAVSNGIGGCARLLMKHLPNVSVAQVLGARSEPLEAGPRVALEQAIAKRDAQDLDAQLPAKQGTARKLSRM